MMFDNHVKDNVRCIKRTTIKAKNREKRTSESNLGKDG